MYQKQQLQLITILLFLLFHYYFIVIINIIIIHYYLKCRATKPETCEESFFSQGNSSQEQRSFLHLSDCKSIRLFCNEKIRPDEIKITSCLYAFPFYSLSPLPRVIILSSLLMCTDYLKFLLI